VDVASGHKRALLDSLYQIRSSGGTPLRSALDQAGTYLECDNGVGLGFPDCPALSAAEGGSCQQNFLAIMTDGFYEDSYKKVGNADGPDNGNTKWDGGAYADKWSDTLGDIAMHYYERDLHPELEDNVPIIPGIDEAKHQHVVTYSIAFGVNGSLDANPLNHLEPFAWPDPQSNNAAKIDDLRHAAYNGRGEFLNAKKPEELVKRLRSLLESIEARTTSAASIALNSGSYNAGSQLYQARFVTGTWSGHLAAFPLDEHGMVQSPVWDTGLLLDTQDWNTGRRILTYDNSSIPKQGLAFRWLDLSPTMQDLLHLDANGVNDGKGQARAEFLRGNRIREGVDFRDRRQVLGDLINSDPIFVGAPSFPNELGAGYETFRNTYTNRQQMLYVGGNDGMLHGFSATDGRELLAYIPRAVFDRLSQLTDPDYRHRFYVDGSPTVADVYGNFGTNRCVASSTCWRSVLVSGLRKGGQAVFGLDVTDPSQFSESQAKNQVIWEFTDADDSDLGYTYSTPSIVKMSGDRWAVMFGNGYNNTEADSYVSSTGQASLFILFFDKNLDGNWILNDNYVKIPVGVTDPVTPNGLASPAAIDIDGDFDADYIYAGDLRGNLWKFDVQNLDPGTWSAAALFKATSDDSTPQPITSQPEVGKHPEGGVMVYFGTGKYLEKSDHSIGGTQTFYGIRDKMEVPTALVARSTLFPQTVEDNGNTRITTTNTTYDDCTTQYNGWYVNLPTSGERQVTDPLLRNQRIIFTTLIPSVAPCSFGGDSWIMEFDAICGNRLDESPFDLNDDKKFTDADKVGDPPIAASGIKSTEGIAPSPSVLFAKELGVEFKYVSGSTGGIFKTIENPGENAQGRIAWQQFK